MHSAAFIFPAVRGTQARREYYVSMVPLEIIAKIFQFADEELPPEVRAQRILNKSRIPEIRDYILSNPESYVFSALTVSVDGDMEFQAAGDASPQVGTISISMTSRFLINDGQHRRAAIAEAIKMNPALKSEHISVVFYRDEGLLRSQQIFSDLNRYAIKPTKSINILFNSREESSIKLGGPQGVGAFVLRRDRTYRRPPVKQLMYGGQQERGYRPGTTPVALVAGFALAAELCDRESAAHMESCKAIRQRFMEAIQGLNYTFNGDQNYCLPSTVNISFHGVDAEGIFLAVKEDYAFSNGSACNSGSHAPSYVLSAMGLDEARVSEAIRISWNHNTKVDFSALANYIRSIA